MDVEAMKAQKVSSRNLPLAVLEGDHHRWPRESGSALLGILLFVAGVLASHGLFAGQRGAAPSHNEVRRGPVPPTSRESPPAAQMLQKGILLLPAGEAERVYERFTASQTSREEAELLFSLSIAAYYDADSQEVIGLSTESASELLMADQGAGQSRTLSSLAQRIAMNGEERVADFLKEVSLRSAQAQANRGKGTILKIPSCVQVPNKDQQARHSLSSSMETSVLSEGFESPSWGRWTLSDNSWGAYTWARVSCDKHSGAFSADPVRGGYSGANLTCSSSYPNSIHNFLVDSQCENVQGSAQAWLDYYFSLNCEGSFYDYLGAYFYGDGQYWGWIYSGNYTPWFHTVENMRQWYHLGDLTSRSCNKVAFLFHSDSYVAPGFGARLDDVSISTGPFSGLSCSISASSPVGPAPLTVSFSGNSSGSSGTPSFLWTFGDGTTSTEQNPAHVYTSVGEYDPFLVVSSGNDRCISDLHVSVTGAANDACAAAQTISSNTYTQTFSTSNFTLEPGEPQPCGYVGATAWYKYIPTQGGTADVSLCGSSYDTVLAVYSGSCGALTTIACNDDSCGQQSALSGVPMDAGVTYYVQVGGFRGASGSAVLNFSFTPACGTYVVSADNENNVGSGQPDGDWGYCLYNDDPRHPIEFDVNMNGPLPQSQAKLLLLCYDVDESQGEVDQVYLNGHYLGNLTGANEQDSTTVLTIPYLSWILSGKNLVQIFVDTANPGNPTWCVWLKKAQLVIDEGCAFSATCRSILTDKLAYTHGQTVNVTTEADTSLASQRVRIESDIYDPAGVNVIGLSQVKTIYGSQDDSVVLSLPLPATGVDGTYTVESLIFDDATGMLQSSCRTHIDVGPPGLQLHTGNFNLANISSIADRFHLWLDITDSSGNAMDPQGWSFSMVSQTGSQYVLADMLETPSLVGGSSTRWKVLFQIRPNSQGKLFFEDGVVRIVSKTNPSLAYTIPSSSLTVSAFGTGFDMARHAFQFANGTWNSPGRDRLFWPDSTWKAFDTINALLDTNKRASFHDSVFSRWLGLLPPKGLCYGMALTSISNYTHSSETNHWGEACPNHEPYCPWNSETDNSWRGAIDARWPQGGSITGYDKPFASSDTYHDTWEDTGGSGNWTLEAAKKIMYYFVAQPFYGGSLGAWCGQDSTDSFTYGLVKSALEKDDPVGLSIFGKWGGHEVVITQALHWNGNYKYIIYDNNQPWGKQASGRGNFMEVWANSPSIIGGGLRPVIMETGNGGSNWNDYVLGFSQSEVLVPGKDSQHIFHPVAPAASEGTKGPETKREGGFAGFGQTTDPTDASYIRVTMIGAESFSVLDDSSGLSLPVIRDGALDGLHAVYQHDPGGVLTQLWLLPDLAAVFRVEVRKDAQIPRFKIYTSVPRAGGVIEKIGYEHVEVSSTDVTLAVIKVGVSNTDHSLQRTSGMGA